jgi:serine/threonine protein kinase
LIGSEERDEPESRLAARGPTSDNSGDKSPHSKGPVKILDMGLAHLDSNDGGQDELTGAGKVMGTVDYMAPEQAIDAHRADGRADIYGLGATLHYLLTGRSMYAGRTTAEKLLAHQSGPIPSLAGVFPDLPLPLEAVFRRMVAKRPEDRYQTMAELIADLEPLLPQLGVALLGTPGRVGSGDQATRRRGVPSRATLSDNRPPWWRDGRKLAAAGAAGLLLIWLSIWVVIRDKDGQEVGRVRLPAGGSVRQYPETVSPRPGTPGSVFRAWRFR